MADEDLSRYDWNVVCPYSRPPRLENCCGVERLRCWLLVRGRGGCAGGVIIVMGLEIVDHTPRPQSQRHLRTGLVTMTDDDFRRLALAFPETTEGRHGVESLAPAEKIPDRGAERNTKHVRKRQTGKHHRDCLRLPLCRDDGGSDDCDRRHRRYANEHCAQIPAQ
jgi:hypothetical protein